MRFGDRKYLFMGGYYHGSLLQVPVKRYGPVIRMSKYRPSTIINPDNLPSTPLDTEYIKEAYIRHKIIGKNRVFYFYLKEGYSIDSAFEELFKTEGVVRNV